MCEDFCELNGGNARMGQMDERYGAGHDDTVVSIREPAAVWLSNSQR